MFDDKTTMRYLAAMFLLEMNSGGRLETCPEDIQRAVNETRNEMEALDDNEHSVEDLLRYALGIRH